MSASVGRCVSSRTSPSGLVRKGEIRTRVDVVWLQSGEGGQRGGVRVVPSSVLLLAKLGVIPSDSANVN